MARYTRNDRRESRNAQLGDGQRHRARPATSCSARTTASPSITPGRRARARCGTFRAGWQRFREPNVRQHEGSSIRRRWGSRRRSSALFGGAQYFPRVRRSTRSATSATTSPATRRTRSTRSSRPTPSWRATTRSAPATTCATITSSARTRTGRRASITNRPRRRVHAPARTTRRRRISRTSRRFLLGLPDRRIDRAQRRSALNDSGTTRVRAGRLEARPAG